MSTSNRRLIGLYLWAVKAVSAAQIERGTDNLSRFYLERLYSCTAGRIYRFCNEYRDGGECWKCQWIIERQSRVTSQGTMSTSTAGTSGHLGSKTLTSRRQNIFQEIVLGWRCGQYYLKYRWVALQQPVATERQCNLNLAQLIKEGVSAKYSMIRGSITILSYLVFRTISIFGS